MTTTVILLLLFIPLVLLYLMKPKEKPKNFPPGPGLRFPFWGHYWHLLKQNYQHAHLALIELGKQHNTPILGLYLGDTPTVVTFSHELTKELLTREEFTGRNDTIITRSRGLGLMRGIFFVDGEYWKHERRFSLRHLRDFGFGRRSQDVEDFVANEIAAISDIFTHPGSYRGSTGDVIRLSSDHRWTFLFPEILYPLLFNSILSLLTSTRFEDEELREIGRTALRFQRSGDPTGCAISFTPWLRFLAPGFFGYTAAIDNNNILLGFLKRTLDEHLETFSDDHHRDFIDVYLSHNMKNKHFDYNQLLLVLLDYMFPAGNAIGHTLNFYFYYLTKYPSVQEKVLQEITTVVGRDRRPDLNDRKLMPYTEASIRESIRILPLNPLGIPRRAMTDTSLGGYFIPKDSIMLPCIWTAHRDETIWGTNPEEFLPERFLDAKGNLLKKDNTVGFGAGKRLCAGETFARQTMFLLVTSLLQRFKMEAADPNKDVGEILVPGGNLSFEDHWIAVSCR